MKGCDKNAISIFVGSSACAMVLFLVGCDGTEARYPASHVAAIANDGAVPSSPLVEAPDGYLYGTTAAGGRFNQGTVYRIGFDGSESVLYSFVGGSDDGADPSGGLIVGSDGNLYGTTRSGGIRSCAQEPPGLLSSVNTCGTVFGLTLSGGEQVLYFFHGAADGGLPVGPLLQTSNGDFYGTTLTGGTYLSGVLYQISALGQQSALYEFGSAGVTDALAPEAGLILGTDGALYGTTPLGGTMGKGTLFSATTAGAETVLASFAGGVGGEAPTQSLMQASDGTLYGTSSGGGLSGAHCPSGCGTVFQVTLSGALTVLYQFGLDAGDGLLPSSALIQASDGNLYGTTRAGGIGPCSGGCGTVFKVTPSGVETVLYSFQGGTDGAAPMAALVQGSDGALYGTTSAGGQLYQGTAFRLTLAGAETVLHSFGNLEAP